ncbi:MAG: DNA-protecting protein DprA [bacterium]|nr:DNA-protecting protein DprA [bacterium]
MPLYKSSPSDKATSVTLSDEQKLNWLRLIRSHNIGPATFWRLINYFGGAEQALDRLPEFQRRSQKHQSQHPSITMQMVERELNAAHKFGATLVARGEHGYPPALAYLDSPPPLLYIKGDADLATLPAVAIVGSRNGSAVGQKFTRRLVQELAQAGYLIVSGLARGIDTAAHTGALEKATMAVIAGGIDNYYPPQNKELQSQIEKIGLVITENPPGFEPRARDFPRRNRIISGCCLGTIVIEANLRSGSLITARLASEQGREVMAVPGHPTDPRAAGPNRLIMSGATMITCASDVLDNLTPMSDIKRYEQTSLFEPDPVQQPVEKIYVEQSARETVLNALSTQAVEIDEIIRTTNLHSREVRIILLELELDGRLEHDGAQNIRLLEPLAS